MKHLRLAAVVVGAVAALTFANASPASAKETFSFSFNTGDVAFAYSDGYWDRSHKWHKWHNTREAREYRSHYASNYTPARHTRVKNGGWRDQDHDGIPNAVDRDRDGDGRSNAHDDAPNNPNRR